MNTRWDSGENLSNETQAARHPPGSGWPPSAVDPDGPAIRQRKEGRWLSLAAV
jgi:hypothetical protein